MSQGKIFGIGLSRTGTTSLHIALLLLGKAAIHYPYSITRHWLEGDFSQSLIKDYDAITDIPTATYYRELDVSFPNSRFILTLRDEESWINSAKQFFNNTIPPSQDTILRDMIRLATYGSIRFEEKRFRRIYQEHNDSVKCYFENRPESLLTLDLTKGQGWKELCEFLDINDVPSYEFPKLQSPNLGEFSDVSYDDYQIKIAEMKRLLFS